MFLGVMLGMGLIDSWWGLLALPGALLIGFAFAAAGLAATTFMRSWQDFDYVNMAILPMFLFSGTFYPLASYPDGLQWVVQATPLYHGVALERALVTGAVGPGLLGHVLYLAVLGGAGLGSRPDAWGGCCCDDARRPVTMVAAAGSPGPFLVNFAAQENIVAGASSQRPRARQSAPARAPPPVPSASWARSST